MSHNDWIPTLCAIAGEPDIVGKCKKGYDGQRHHLQGPPRRLRPVASSSRPSKARSARTTAPRAPATGSSTPTTTACSWPCGRATTSTSSPSSACRARWRVWAEPFTKLRLQKIFNLMQDPVRAGRHHLQHLLGLADQPRRARCIGVMDEVVQYFVDASRSSRRARPAELQPGDIMEERSAKSREFGRANAARPRSGGTIPQCLARLGNIKQRYWQLTQQRHSWRR